jgi:hypothetical protein
MKPLGELGGRQRGKPEQGLEAGIDEVFGDQKVVSLDHMAVATQDKAGRRCTEHSLRLKTRLRSAYDSEGNKDMSGTFKHAGFMIPVRL